MPDVTKFTTLTFDCYGTLIDWERGILAELRPWVEAWVDGTTLRIGQKQATAAAVSAPVSPIGKEIAGRDWMLAIFGRGTLFTTMNVPPIPVDQLPPEALAVLRAAVLLNELGFGVRVDGDKVQFVIDVRTVFANPDDVLGKVLAIQPRQVFTGEAGTLAKQLADSAPGSPFAADFAAGYGGLMLPAAALGTSAAVATSAFMDYMKKSKQSEAALQLGRLARALKAEASANAAFPKGKVAQTTPCCESGGTCSDPSAWKDPMWQALDFSIEEPHRFRYGYESDGKTFTATAIGDLDCDGIEITYRLTGSFDAQGNPSTQLEEPARNTD